MTDTIRPDDELDTIRNMDRALLERALLYEREYFRTLVESVSAILWQCDRDFRISLVSPEAEKLLGYPTERWIGEPTFWIDHIHPDDRNWVFEFCKRETEGLRKHDLEYRMTAADGRVVWLRDIVNVIASDGKPDRLFGVMVDITAAKETELALNHLAELQHILVEASGRLIRSRVDDSRKTICQALAEIGSHCGVDRTGMFLLDTEAGRIDEVHEWHRDDIPPLQGEWQQRTFDETPRLFDSILQQKVVQIEDVSALDDTWKGEREVFGNQHIRSALIVPIIVDGEVVGEIGFDDMKQVRTWSDAEVRALRAMADIIGATLKREQDDAQLRESRALLEIAERTARIGGWRADLKEDRIISSPEANNVVGIPRERELSMAESLDYYSPESREHIQSCFAACARRGIPYDEELEVILPDGTTIWVREIGEPVYDDEGNIVQVRGSIQNITEQKAIRKEVEYLALYDPLSNLPNRRLLHDRLHQALAASRRHGTGGAALFIDIDNFKTINDTLGHAIGDDLLQQAARRLQECIRRSDTVARLGGDEFMVLLTDLEIDSAHTGEQAARVAEKILKKMIQPYELGESTRTLTVSIGVALFESGDDAVDDLMQRADLAMYQAKESGKNAIRMFEPAMRTAVYSRVNVENDLRLALERDELAPWYQLQVDARNQVTGVEALARWFHPERGMLTPGEFIAVAEETNLIIPLGDYILEAACRQLASWSGHTELRHLDVAVNISARQFHHPEFVENVTAILARTGADPRKLWLELTESMLLSDIEDTARKMARLKTQDIRFAIDDFGTGYSSLAYLKRLPLDMLKIDQGFVRDARFDPNDEAIARTIIVLAHNLEMGVIAEGVEDEPTRSLLSRHGCRRFQGFLFGAPMPVSDIERAVAPPRDPD